LRPLNQDTIPVLRKILDQATQPCPPYVVDYGDTVIVTNQSLLIEWPSELVDRDCPQYNKLLLNGDNKLAAVKARLEEKDWRDVLFHPDGKFVDAKEIGPDEDEVGQDAVIFAERVVSRTYYHWTNIELVEFFITDPYYMRYKQPPEQDIAAIMHMLAVFQRDVGPIGVFANQHPGG
jgi:hypothetical protein